MAGFTFDGMDDLERLLDQIGALPDSVLDEMLDAEAPTVIEEQKRTAPRNTGTLADYISQSHPRAGRHGERYLLIFPKGIHHRTTARRASSAFTKQRYKLKPGQTKAVTNAEVGLIHEIGAPGRNIPASQWMKRANEKAAGPALQAAVQVYDSWLQSLS